MYTSDSLETILSHLFTRVTNVLANGGYLLDLHYLLEFLAAWEKRPECLTPMAYQWCSAASEVAGRDGWGELFGMGGLESLRFELQASTLGEVPYHLWFFENEISKVGHRWDFLRLDDTSNRACGHSQDLTGLTTYPYVGLLYAILEIGFRLVTPSRDQQFLKHTSHHIQVFEIAFSSIYDGVVADAVSIWIAGLRIFPPCSCIYYITKRMERGTPFSPRLRRVSIQAIEHTYISLELETSVSETVRLLNHLDVSVVDIKDEGAWVRLLVGVICLPAGQTSLSSHYWHLLGRLAVDKRIHSDLLSLLKVMRLLEKAGNWEKLEIWMVVLWMSVGFSTSPSMMEEIEQVTLKLVSQRASALPRFEDLCVQKSVYPSHQAEFQRTCDQARAEQLPSESPPRRYVSIPPARCLSVLMPPLFFASVGRLTSSRSFYFLWWETTPSERVCRVGRGLMYKVEMFFLEHTEEFMISRKVTSERH